MNTQHGILAVALFTDQAALIVDGVIWFIGISPKVGSSALLQWLSYALNVVRFRLVLVSSR